jgi:proteasome component ECM29
MAIGEALVNCALGKRSTASSNTWLTNLNDDENLKITFSNNDHQDANLKWLLNELLTNYLQNANQHLRQASSFWLLILVKKCCKLSQIIMDNLFQIQEAFIQRLGENDEITQEVASKGIGIIFSLADEEQKKSLVAKIVSSLGGGDEKAKKKAAFQSTNVTSAESGLKIQDENEQIFQQSDQLGKSPDGANIGTYKEICSLASDLNRPDLIYQFMNLAHHNSIWNTRKGAAFGFNTIAEIAREQLQPYLSDIVPKLYRYQFDPNPKIQQSMSSIWDSLIKNDNKKIVDLYLKEILVDIEQNMLSNLWRIRESCCNALCDLLKGGRNLEAISGKFGIFWSLLFKLADDIKESVRGSAQIALKSLQRVTISYSSLVSSKNVCESTINSVLPILIVDGLQSSLNEVRNISVLTIRDLTKQSSSALIKPYLIDMIVSLLETLSGYEPPDLNYISLKLGSQDAQEKLDMARISASKGTPMIEIINMNLEYLNDETIVAELIPRLLEIVKKGLGVSTKAGVCHIISSLVDLQPQLMIKFSGKIMSALVNSMSTEQNKTINKCYCSAIGSIVKVAKESSIENLLNKLQEWYFEKDEDGIKQSCGLALLAIVQNNPEIASKYSKKCIPFVFFAMHQQNENQMKLKQKQLEQMQQNQFKTDIQQQQNQQQSSIWDDLWEEITSGTEYAIRANLNEILPLIKLGLDHQSWNQRIQASLAICTICFKMQSNIELKYLNELLSMLIAALNTRTWNGKDKILIAVSCLFSNCK